jgi:signal transduction histidine kinase
VRLNVMHLFQIPRSHSYDLAQLRNPLGAIDLTLDNVPQRLRELIAHTPDTAVQLKEIVHDIDCLNIRWVLDWVPPLVTVAYDESSASCAHMRRLIDDVLSLSKLGRFRLFYSRHTPTS